MQLSSGITRWMRKECKTPSIFLDLSNPSVVPHTVDFRDKAVLRIPHMTPAAQIFEIRSFIKGSWDSL
jgi:hypothetical protein